MSVRSPADRRQRHRENLRRRAQFVDGQIASADRRLRMSEGELAALTWALAVIAEVTGRGLMPELDQSVQTRLDGHYDGEVPLW